MMYDLFMIIIISKSVITSLILKLQKEALYVSVTYTIKHDILL